MDSPPSLFQMAGQGGPQQQGPQAGGNPLQQNMMDQIAKAYQKYQTSVKELAELMQSTMPQNMAVLQGAVATGQALEEKFKDLFGQAKAPQPSMPQGGPSMGGPGPEAPQSGMGA